jgi:hypothetical protein
MAQTRYDCQGLLIQLETALHQLVESFWDQPYRFFTEADAVAGLQAWVAARPELAQLYVTADGFETGLLHCEYPTCGLLRLMADHFCPGGRRPGARHDVACHDAQAPWACSWSVSRGMLAYELQHPFDTHRWKSAAASQIVAQAKDAGRRP